MKKKILAMLLLLACAFMLTACSGNGNNHENPVDTAQTVTYTVTFDLNYDGANQPHATQTVESRKAATEPTAPTREDYAFDSWYEDSAGSTKVDFENAISADRIYYAKWIKTVATITLDPNYPDAQTSVVKVNVGDKLTQPADPAREGYSFTAWYTDGAATAAYDLNTVVADDFTLYAGWEQASSGNNNVTVKFLYNYEGAPSDVYYEREIVSGRRVTKPSAPVREGYSFRGWFTEPEGINEYTLPANPKEDVTLYAYWLKVFTFEAEDTNVDNIEGSGYSGEVSGKQIIARDDGDLAASNGHYVTYLFRPGIELNFDVVASAATDNAIVALSLSAEYMDIVLTSETYTVEVNGTKLSYDDISITGATPSSRVPFMTFEISNVTLNEGSNNIKLITSNDIVMGGTMVATAPVVDCVYVYADVELAWAEGFPRTDNY